MLEAIGAILLWGVAPTAIMVLVARRWRVSSICALCALLALQFGVSLVLVLAVPELAAMALFTEPATPGDKLDFGAGLFVAGATMLLGTGFGAALLINAWIGIAELRRGTRACI
ncbi:MAG: hypothetical protein ACJAVR_004019 [Paracoccaceae bacterium]|jgi:hypothetical protein